MCHLYQIKRVLTSHVNNLLTKGEVVDCFTSGALGESRYGKRMCIQIETIDPRLLLEWVVRELDHTCIHEWVEDEIEMPDESIMLIKYCCHCENNLN